MVDAEYFKILILGTVEQFQSVGFSANRSQRFLRMLWTIYSFDVCNNIACNSHAYRIILLLNNKKLDTNFISILYHINWFNACECSFGIINLTKIILEISIEHSFSSVLTLHFILDFDRRGVS